MGVEEHLKAKLLRFVRSRGKVKRTVPRIRGTVFVLGGILGAIKS